MWTLPLSFPQKVGVILYGLVVGACTALVTSAALCLLGVVISLFAQYTGIIHLGEYQPWLPIVGLEYGFFLGIVFGVIVGVKVCASRLRS
jgi:hypothetical protein